MSFLGGGSSGGGQTTTQAVTPYGAAEPALGQILSEAGQLYGQGVGAAGYVPPTQQTLQGLAAQEAMGTAAQQQLAQQQLNQPLQAAQTYGSGVTSLIAGYPGKSVQEMTPAASPISTALGIGSTLAGIYRAVR